MKLDSHIALPVCSGAALQLAAESLRFNADESGVPLAGETPQKNLEPLKP